MCFLLLSFSWIVACFVEASKEAKEKILLLLFYCIRNYTAYTHGCPDHKHTQYKKHTHNGEEEDKESITIRKEKDLTHTHYYDGTNTHTQDNIS